MSLRVKMDTLLTNPGVTTVDEFRAVSETLRDEAHALFSLVSPPGVNWKAPINAWVPVKVLASSDLDDLATPVPAELVGRDLDDLVYAVEFFTGTTPTVTMIDTPFVRYAHVQSVGYAAGPAGDH